MIAGTTILGNFHLLVVLVALHLACAEVESEELHKELPQGIDISAFFTTHITPVITLAPLLCIYIHNFPDVVNLVKLEYDDICSILG